MVHIALDAGTTSCRSLVFEDDGRVLAVAQQEFEQHFPGDGQVEHDADEIARVQRETMVAAWREAGSPTVDGVGITNQRETVVVFDRTTGRPIHRAIVWQDRRTAADLATMRADGHEDDVRAATGLPLDPYFSAAKVAWILDRVPGARARAEAGELGVATIDAWLIHQLTGGEVFATEPSNASRTSLFDIDAGGWSEDLAQRFGVPVACLPEVRDSVDEFGFVTGHGWPIRAALGDQQSALFGHSCLQPGEAKCTYGTGAFLLQQCGARRPTPEQGVLATVAWRLGGRLSYAMEGSVLVAGAAIQWLRDGLGVLPNAAASEALARSVPDSGGVVFVPAFAGLGTPHWDPDARGLLIGLTRGTTVAHIARATLEALALQVDDVCRAMAAVSGAPMTELRVDGGAVANELLLELQAGVGGIPVLRPAFLETTAFGAFRGSLLGARGCAVEDLPLPPGEARRVLPGATTVDSAGLRRLWQSAVDRAKGWARLTAGSE